MLQWSGVHHDESAIVGLGAVFALLAAFIFGFFGFGVPVDYEVEPEPAQISSNIFIETIVGERSSSTADGLNNMTLYVSLAPGASELDLSEMSVQVSNGTKRTNFDHVDGAADADSYNVTEVRDSDDSFTSANPTMSAGDLIKVFIDLSSSAANMPFEVRDDIWVILAPEAGPKVEVGFSTPSSWGTNIIIHLY